MKTASLDALQSLPVQLLQVPAQPFDGLLGGLHLFPQGLHGLPVGAGFGLQAAGALAGAGQLGLRFGDLGAGVVVLVAQHGQPAVAAGAGFGQGADLGVGLLHRQHQLLGFGAQRLGAGVELVQLAGQALVVRLGGFVPALLVPGGVLGPADGVHPEGDLQAFAGVGIFQEFLGFLAVPLQRAHPAFQFAQDVPQPFQVALGGGQAALGLVFAVAEPGDAGGFLENFPPLAGFGGDDLGNAALADDGVAVPAQAGVQQQLVDILEADVLAVDGVLALAAAVVPAADGDLVGVHRQAVVGVVDGQADGGVAHGPAGLGAAEDHVLHLAGAPQLFGAGLAHDPADGVGDVAFARAIGPHHAGDAGADGDFGAVGEGFEPLDLKLF